MPAINPPCVLIATLGSESQVITATLHLLFSIGEFPGRLLVLHTQAPGTPVAAAVERLHQAFYPSDELSDRISHLPILQFLVIRDENGLPLPDVETPQAARAVFRTLYQAIRAAKQAGERVHLSIAGGRKTMAIFGMVAAQMLFDDTDRLWHLHSSGNFLTSKRLIPQPGDLVHLIPIPVIRWSQVSPLWRGLDAMEDPQQALDRIEKMRLAETIEQGRSFILGSLTPAEARVVELMVREGLSDHEIGQRLSLSPRTVEQHLRSAYQKAAAHWELANVNRAQLVAILNLYYFTQIAGKPA